MIGMGNGAIATCDASHKDSNASHGVVGSECAQRRVAPPPIFVYFSRDVFEDRLRLRGVCRTCFNTVDSRGGSGPSLLFLLVGHCSPLQFLADFSRILQISVYRL